MIRIRWPKALLLGVSAPLLIVLGLNIRTPGRQARWLAEYEATKLYLATADANFDEVVRTRGIDLVALDSATRREVAGAWTNLGATIAVRRFVWTFFDGHTWARVRPAIWWDGVKGEDLAAREARRANEETARTADEDAPDSRSPALLSTLSAAEACSIAGLDIGARPDGWELPFPEAAGAELLADEEFPAVLLTLPDGRKVGILRVANFGHEHFGPTCGRAWEKIRRKYVERCPGECKWEVVAATMREGAARAAEVANELRRRGAVAVVVDITGNGGGSELSDAMARALTATPLRIAPGGFIRHPLHVRDLQEQREAIIADTARATAAQRPLLLAALARLDTLQVEAARDCGRAVVWSGGRPACSNTVVTPPFLDYTAPGTLDGLADGWVLFSPAWYEGAEGLYRGPLLILQDRRSASASEEFAARLQDNGAAKVVGERSLGAGCGYMNGGTRLELPALGLLVRTPDCVRLRMDGRNEIEGVAPDVTVGWTGGDSPAVRVTKALDAIGQALRP